MKIAGLELSPMGAQTVVLPRGEKDIVITAAPVRDYVGFDQLCPRPKPPSKITPGGEQFLNPEDPEYLVKLNDWAGQRIFYMFIKSLTIGTPDLEFETVKIDDPTTWKNIATELEAVFSGLELKKITDAIRFANGLDEEKIDQATRAFLAGQRLQARL